MAAWFLKSRSSLQLVKIRSGVHEIFNRSLFCGLTHHCNNFVTSSNVHCSHVSFLRLTGYWVGLQASQHSKAFKLEKDSACSENEFHLLPSSSSLRISPRKGYLAIEFLIIAVNVSPPAHQNCKKLAVKLYSSMVTLQMMDTVFNEMQTQGRTSFYMASHGEEAINIASAAALTNDDVICPQYREQEFFYGVVSACKNSLTKCLQIKKILEKEGRCLDILGLISTTTSPSHRLQLLKFHKLLGLLILLKWKKRMHALLLILGMAQAVREISMLV